MGIGGDTHDSRANIIDEASSLQIKDILALRIADERWAGGTSIPSEQDLASQFKVSVATIRKSLAELEKDGMITRQQGRGTFVTDRLSEAYMSKYDRIRRPDGTRFDWLFLEKQTRKSFASNIEAQRLAIEPGAPIYNVHRLRRGDRKVYMREHAIYAAASFPDLDADRPHIQGIVSLTHGYKLVPGPYVQTLQNVPADESFAVIAGIAPGIMVWGLTRTTRDHDGRIIEYRECMVTPEGCAYRHEHE